MVSHKLVTEQLHKLHEMRRDPFQAIADPTRRGILDLLAGQSLNLQAVADNFKVSRPAISRHVKILAQCGLILVKQQGRERYCEARLENLNEVADWVEQYRVFWTSKLDALGDFLEKDNKKTSIRKPIKKSKRK